MLDDLFASLSSEMSSLLLVVVTVSIFSFPFGDPSGVINNRKVVCSGL
jgi:hypothetical protein